MAERQFQFRLRLTRHRDRAWENSRPIAAPVCATSLAGPSRSSRAISEACRLAGTASTGDGTHANRLRGRALAFGFQHRFRHFLHKQRNAVSALDDVLSDVRRDEPVANDRVDHGIDFALRQPIDGKGGYVWPSDPWRLELRPERYDQQHTKGRDPIHDPTQQFEARGIGPMSILENHQNRILACKGPDLYSKGFQRFCPPLRRGVRTSG